MTHSSYRPRKNIIALLALLLAITVVVANISPAYAATLTTASLSLSDPRPGTTNVTYDFQANNVSLSAINCIKLVFSDTSTGTTVPTNMVTTGASALGGDYVTGTWTTDAATNGTIKYTNASGATPGSASDRNITISGIKNGSVANTGYFLQVSTYANTDCSTSPVDTATVQFIFTNGQSVTMAVDGSLTFGITGVTGTPAGGGEAVNGADVTVTATGTTLPFGTITAAKNQVAAQDLAVATNAGNGYTVYIRYTGKPTNGNGDTIADLAGASNTTPGAFSASGTEAFGYTTNDSSLGTGTPNRFTVTGGNKWAPFTTTNAEVAFNSAATVSETTRVGFQTGVSTTTKPGSYTTTVIYTATPVY